MTVLDTPALPASARLRVAIRGAVQGVGFRPSVYRLATGLGLTGWVQNDAQGVVVEVEGPPAQLEQFLLRLEREKPARAAIHSMEPLHLDPAGYVAFRVVESDTGGARSAIVMPDLGTCDDCRREIFEPSNRRFRYPFTNCTNCGPRFTIVEALPYDRAATTMRGFTMCPACQAEYDDPLDRRFHAQPNACPACGPALELWDGGGRVQARQEEALLATVEALRQGRIVAVKGVGGFHLMVDARNAAAVALLRARKRRPAKPFALLYPSLERIAVDCELAPLEARLLAAPEAPIVLLRRRGGQGSLAADVAPGSPYLGIMLPANPLHHLLMAELATPLVATSGNLSDEPICVDEHEALRRLAGIADLFLVHNRPIAHHVDDSIARVVMGRELLLRRARGYAPLPIPLPRTPAPPILAMGGHMKNTAALAVGDQLLLSQHIGDLGTAPACAALEHVVASLLELYATQPALIACDQHPDYGSTQAARALAEERGLPLIQTQHHLAHVLACMAENQLDGPALGVAWDGTGYGDDGTIWGGELFVVRPRAERRVATLRPFPLVGGEQAAREPRRAAFGLLSEIYGPGLVELEDLAPVRACRAEQAIFLQMIRRGLNTPWTSSVGRLFDAVAALLDLQQGPQYEGQAAAALEHACGELRSERSYPFELVQCSGLLRVDWEPLLRTLIADLRQGRDRALIAVTFHNTLANIVLAVAEQIGERRVVLSGGCFQNAALLERTVHVLRAAGMRPYWHQRLPPNDGGIAAGQILDAVRRMRRVDWPPLEAAASRAEAHINRS